MSEDALYLPWWVRTIDPVTVTPALGAWRAAGPLPPARRRRPGVTDPPPEHLPLTFWVDGHPIASRWYPVASHYRIRDSAFFRQPVSVVFVATFLRSERGWARVDVCACGCFHEQVGELLGLYREGRTVVPLIHVGYGRVALSLGHHWVPVDKDLIRLLETDPDAALDASSSFNERTCSWILNGDDAEVADRLLRSIPGIRGQRRVS